LKKTRTGTSKAGVSESETNVEVELSNARERPAAILESPANHTVCGEVRAVRCPAANCDNVPEEGRLLCHQCKDLIVEMQPIENGGLEMVLDCPMTVVRITREEIWRSEITVESLWLLVDSIGGSWQDRREFQNQFLYID